EMFLISYYLAIIILFVNLECFPGSSRLLGTLLRCAWDLNLYFCEKLPTKWWREGICLFMDRRGAPDVCRDCQPESTIAR
ncbi:MAG: hypothetical protein AAF387_21440, partial [Pseudomonadota bacterium]